MKIGEIQELVFKILCDIDDYCRENGIQYYLSGGSCLGAVRHQGFIPWDDDADIMIPRQDFERFIEGFAKTNQHKYGVGSLSKDHEWQFPYGRIWDLSTKIYHKNLNMKKMGVFVDVFPIDGLPDEPDKQKILYAKLKVYNAMRNAALRVNFQQNEKWKLTKSVLGIYCRKKGARYFAEKMETEVLKYPFEKSQYVAVSLVCHYGSKETIQKTCMSQAEQLVFNGRSFPVPIGYDTYLRNLYGDYMQIPKDIAEKGYTHLDNWEISLNTDSED